jgi:3-oxoacyl-[acyl-carrier protein] reductase
MLKDKVVVITGGTRGIGYEIARKFAQNGSKLGIIASRMSEQAIKNVDELQKMGTEVRLYICDIKDSEQVETEAKRILDDFGSIDILINNAGITRDNLLPSLGIAEIDEVIDVNLKGTIYVTRAFIKNFVRQRHGNIINISSVVGMMGNKGQTNYAASKAGIIGFTKSVAKEYGRKNIRCNAIAPGYIATEMTGALTGDMVENIKQSLPLGMLGEPSDVANLALFLADDCSKYITGEVIKVDGGMYV